MVTWCSFTAFASITLLTSAHIGWMGVSLGIGFRKLELRHSLVPMNACPSFMSVSPMFGSARCWAVNSWKACVAS